MRVFIHATIHVLFLISLAKADRTAPAEVPTITTGEAVYSVPHFSVENGTRQNGGVIHVHHPKTKKLLWSAQIYKTIYDEDLEGDIQDVFIKSLSFDKEHNLLMMSDEKSRIFVLNLNTRNVTQIE